MSWDGMKEYMAYGYIMVLHESMGFAFIPPLKHVGFLAHTRLRT